MADNENSTQSWTDRYKAVMMNNYGTPRIELVSGHGTTVVDSEGKEYLDMLSGIAVTALGQTHPKIVDAVSKQIATLGHVSNIFAHEPALDLASRLIDVWGAPKDESKVFFCNSGTEANEAAFKMARRTGRYRIIAADHGFHGRTMGALAMTGQAEKRRPFTPMPNGVEFTPYGNIEYLRTLIEMAPKDTAAVILEPIQGETGVVAPPEGYLKAVREITAKHGILMILDEVQTGMGRTGDWFAHTREGIIPDVVTMAKGLGGGLPLGAVLATGEAAELLTPGTHGTTFGGNPVCCAAGLAVMDVIEEDGLLEHVANLGRVTARQLTAFDQVNYVRGRGLMLGVVLNRPIAKQTVTEGLKRGLILNAPQTDVIRLVPPLNTDKDTMAQAIKLLGEALAAAEEAFVADSSSGTPNVGIEAATPPPGVTAPPGAVARTVPQQP